jgi:hypothetical protein
MRAVRWGMTLLLASILAGCGSVGDLASLLPTDGTGSDIPVDEPTRQPTDSLPPTPAFFVTCDIVSLGEVQAMSPLRSPLAYSEPDDGAEDRCRYNSSIDPPVDWPNSIVLILRDMGTPEDAQEALEVFRSAESRVSTPVSGLGDEAYKSDEGQYRALVAAIRGQYWASVDIADSGNLEFPEVPLAQKQDFGIELVRLGLSRIP